ncbi:unnamed protein product [Owenia fusiformis]|uniref:Uncharacterized protein n=1 Tax=Owenia fusiformis TaxID=6347 RepID=A0A8S4PUT7_OWEFU|nr:unnamed protein product [Owenia fusiformis]
MAEAQDGVTPSDIKAGAERIIDEMAETLRQEDPTKKKTTTKDHKSEAERAIDDMAETLDKEERVKRRELLRMINMEKELAILKKKYLDEEIPDRKTLADTQSASSTPETSSKNTQYISKKPKLSKFMGNKDEDIYDWIEDATMAIRDLKNNSEKEDFVVYHLGPNPRREARYLTNPTPTEIFKTLQRVFGIHKSSHKSMTEFYTRKQHPNETIAQYTQAFMKLMDIVKQNQDEKVDEDKLLKEQLIEGVCCPKMRWELRGISDYNSSTTFHTLRETAFQYELNEKQSDSMETKKTTANTVDSNNTLHSMMRTLLEKQNKMENELNEIKEMKNNPQQNFNSYGRGQFNNRFNRGQNNYRGRGRSRGNNYSRRPSNYYNSNERYDNHSVQVNDPKNSDSKPNEVITNVNLTTDTTCISCHPNMEKIVGETQKWDIKIGDIETTGIMDSGSSVMLMSKEFYENQFVKELQPFQLLDLKAANNLKIPYKGLLIEDIIIQDITIKDCGILVHEESGSYPDLLIGMNVLKHLPTFQSTPNDTEERTHLIRVKGQVFIPASTTVDVDVSTGSFRGQGLVEPLDRVLPGNVQVMNGYIDATSGSATIRVLNASETSVILTKRTPIGQLHSATVNCCKVSYSIQDNTVKIATNENLKSKPIENDEEEPTVP